MATVILRVGVPPSHSVDYGPFVAPEIRVAGDQNCINNGLKDNNLRAK